MPWCPNCKNEYVEGIEKCADCGCLLTASLDEEQEAVIFGELAQMNRLMAFLRQNDVGTAALREDEAEHVYEIFVAGSERERAKRIVNVFLAEEAKRQQESVWEEETERTSETERVYEDSAQKAASYKDSGYTLIGIGAAGLLAVVLTAAGVIPLRLGGNSYLLYGVMGTMFALFLVIGIRSMRSAKTYKKKALSESNVKEEIMSWCRGSFTADGIDEEISREPFLAEGLSEEERYFKRIAYVKDKVSEKFINLEDGFLDSLIDEFYSEIFGE